MPTHDESRRAYDDAVLAALDFRPRAVRTRRRYDLALIVVVHVVVSVVFGELLARGQGGPPLALAALAWVACVGAIVRAVFTSAAVRSASSRSVSWFPGSWASQQN